MTVTADPVATVDGTTITRTTSGDSYTADVADTASGVSIRLVGSDGTIDGRHSPTSLLTLLKHGEVYLPDGDQGVQDALRTLADRGGN